MKHSKSIFVGIGAALVLSLVNLASAAPRRDWAEWVNHYYQSPRADQVVPAVYGLSRSGYFEQPGQPATAIGFLSTVFAQNPDKVADWLTAFRDLPAAHQRLVAAALWYSRLPEGDRQLRALARNSSPEMMAA